MAKTEIMTAGLAGKEVSQDAEAEQVVQLKLSELHPFEGHPFQVRDDEEMQQMVESLSEFGVLVPLIVRRILMEDMKFSPDIAGTGPVSWQKKKQYLRSSVIWMMMQRLSSCVTAICREKISCRVSEPGLLR